MAAIVGSIEERGKGSTLLRKHGKSWRLNRRSSGISSVVVFILRRMVLHLSVVTSESFGLNWLFNCNLINGSMFSLSTSFLLSPFSGLGLFNLSLRLEDLSLLLRDSSKYSLLRTEDGASTQFLPGLGHAALKRLFQILLPL
ncbi:hypothetical protein HG530_008838 [Fusarium avenaceum]|nr:hypothetical protein HG530_008838 [Fusarium avenaceum]